MKALLFTSGNLKHASIGEPEDASAKFQGEKRTKKIKDRSYYGPGSVLSADMV